MAKHIKVNGYELNENENENNSRLINELPDEIVMSSILTLLPFNQVARTCVLSRHWNRSWHRFSMLNFESWTEMNKIYYIKSSINRTRDFKHITDELRPKYINWVHDVIGKHIGSVIDQFKITFDLDNTNQSDIDFWVTWAFVKHVKILELDLREYPKPIGEFIIPYLYCLHQPLIDYCFFTMKVKPLLTSLCLKNVNVTTQVVQLLLVTGCCSTLENLCIEKSDYLTSIKAYGSSTLQSLKYFKVLRCSYMETIDIDAPKLLSFTYDASSLRLLRVANASSLSQVSAFVHRDGDTTFSLHSLENYFPQLGYLNLKFSLPENINLRIDFFSVLANLKHLELHFTRLNDQTLLGLIPLVEACPLLEKLTLEILRKSPSSNKEVKRARHPFRCLKTFRMKGFVCTSIDSDFAKFVFENGIALEEVVVAEPFVSADGLSSDRAEAQAQIQSRLQAEYSAWKLKLPRGVKLIVADVKRWRFMLSTDDFPFPSMCKRWMS